MKLREILEHMAAKFNFNLTICVYAKNLFDFSVVFQMYVGKSLKTLNFVYISLNLLLFLSVQTTCTSIGLISMP